MQLEEITGVVQSPPHLTFRGRAGLYDAGATCPSHAELGGISMSHQQQTPSRTLFLACILAAALTSLALTGCDGEGSSDSDNGAEATAKAAQQEAAPSTDEEPEGQEGSEEMPSSGSEDAETESEEGAAADSDESEGAEESGDSSSDEGPKDETSDDSESDDLAGGLYPGMKFTKLSSEDRKKFVSIAEKELCPCPDAAQSLHACLQSKETQCDTARRAAMSINRGLVQGLGESEILDKLATFVDKATTKYEFNLENAPHKGPADAPVKVVEFADFQCPHCKRASQMMTKLHEEMGDDVVIYFKHFPLTPGSMAEMAARAAEAARRQGKFWKMQELLFENQKTLSRDKIMGFARRIGLNFGKFEQDLNDPAVAKAVQGDRSEGMEADISGTPAIFIDGYRYTGTLNYNAIKSAVEGELSAE